MANSEPRYTVEVEWAAGDYVYLTSHADCAAPGGAQKIHCLIAAPVGSSQKIDPLKGTGSIGTITLRCADPGGSLTSEIYSELISGNGIRHKRVRCYVGERGESWSSYNVAWTFRAGDVSWDGAAYSISTSDIQRSAKTKILRPNTGSLRETISATADRIPVAGLVAADLPLVEHDSQWGDRPDETVGYIRIDGEIICHSGISVDATLGSVVDVVQRGALGTIPATHEADQSQAEERRTKVEEFIYLELAAPKCAYAILTGDLYGQGSATLPDHWHLAIDTDWVQLSDYTGDDGGLSWRFEGLKAVEGKKFVEQVLRGWGYPLVHPDGRLGVRRITHILSGAATTKTLDASNVVAKGQLKHATTQVANVAAVKWDWDWRTDQYRRTRVLVDTPSIGTHGLAPEYTLELRGAHPARQTDSALFALSSAIRSRYSGPPVIISGVQVLKSEAVAPGEIVRYAMPGVPDVNEGTQDIDRAFEVVGISYGDGVTDSVTLFGSSASAGAIDPGSAGHRIDDDEYDTGSSLGSRTDLDGTYHHLGDLTIDRRITVNNTTVLWVRGHLTLADDCDLDGEGRGHAGGAAGSPGVAGIGQTASGGSVLSVIVPHYDDDNVQTSTRSHREYLGRHVGSGNSVSIPEPVGLQVVNGALQGLPTDLAGTGGHGGPESGVHWHQTGTSALQPGGAGGDGGAALIIICRGLSYAAGARINLSGDAGSAGSLGEGCYSGHGAPGHPGGLLVIIDGDYTRPNMADILTANTGAPVTTGTALPVGGAGNGNAGSDYRSRHTSYAQTNLAQSMALVRYAPSSGQLTEPTQPDITQPQVTGLVVGLRLPTRIAAGGARYGGAYIDWAAAAAQAGTLAGYELQVMIGDSSWRALASAGPDASGAPVELEEGVEHSLRVRALSSEGADYHGPWSEVLAVTLTRTLGGIPSAGPNMLADPRFLDATRGAWLGASGADGSERLATGGEGGSPCVQMVANGAWGHHFETLADYEVQPGERYQLSSRYRVVIGLNGSGFYGFVRFLDAAGAEVVSAAQFAYYPDTGSTAAYRDASIVLEVPADPTIVAMRAGWNINADNSSGEVRLDSVGLQRIVGTTDIDADAVTAYAYAEAAGPIVWGGPPAPAFDTTLASPLEVSIEVDNGPVMMTLEFNARLLSGSGGLPACQHGDSGSAGSGGSWVISRGIGMDSFYLASNLDAMPELTAVSQKYVYRHLYEPPARGVRYYPITFQGGPNMEITDVLFIVQALKR